MIEPVTLTPEQARPEIPFVVVTPPRSVDPEVPNLTRRAAEFAKRIAEIEDIQTRIEAPDLDFPDPDSTRKYLTKELKKLHARLDTLQKQVNRSYYRVNPAAEKATDKPIVESTTLWDFPTQSYGKTKKGDSGFQGVTPAFIVYNMLQRYTEPGDLVLDPMCGSGTTIDVCAEEGREVIGYDINPVRSDVIRNDSRSLPLGNDSVDMVFIDSPYGDNVDYSDDPENIGKLSAEGDEFYESLKQVASELYRVLRPGKALGWLIGDQWVKRKFTPVGFNIYDMLTNGVGFEPVDLICVTRRNQSSNTGVWHYRAVKHNFFLRGFKTLIIVRKPEIASSGSLGNGDASHDWQRYKPKLPSQLNGHANPLSPSLPPRC